MKVAVIANSAWYLYNFRRNLLRELKAHGHTPLAIGPGDAYAGRLQQEGFAYRPLALAAAGTNPLHELRTLYRLRRVLVEEGIEIAFTFTPKPNIYTGLAAWGLPLTHVPNVSGLGRVFIHRNWLTPLVQRLYRLAFRRSDKVIFQNEDDRRVFLEHRLVAAEKTLRVPGSGVDLVRFAPAAAPDSDAPVVFLLVARMLWDKGVGEFVEAAREVRRAHPDVRFELLGSTGSANPAAIPVDTLRGWVAEGVVTHTDHVDDVRPHIERAHCVVLPSYREGLPRTLLEAAAMARPLIATDVPGCRDTVTDGENGFLCAPADAQSLARAMERFLALGAPERAAMGERGRRRVEAHFSEAVVLDTYVSIAARGLRGR